MVVHGSRGRTLEKDQTLVLFFCTLHAITALLDHFYILLVFWIQVEQPRLIYTFFFCCCFSLTRICPK
ncbi:hypothetical protein BC939DRAFT_463537 [Gamsiella multidivaricata]|uniref:uncharacterized protein n=1 Tax=Gamsiella multidivaricata TaxID=101098 RepID=UPI002220BC82|nr:uncharacterized protein BC939DRAFT_463537 [Gamsiella multidivaricata]KAI7818298.1 hypothetical protein BC939DRAFT_463537 [Gamsiella multidivaricata]